MVATMITPSTALAEDEAVDALATTSIAIIETNVGMAGYLTSVIVELDATPDGGSYVLEADGEVVATTDAVDPIQEVQWTPPLPGDYELVATYTGSATLASSTSDPVNAQVTKAIIDSITVDADPDPVGTGDAVELTAVLSPDPGSGSVQFLVDDEALGTAPLENGKATLQTSIDTVGEQSLVARFLGNELWAAKDSEPVTITVLDDGPGISISLPAAPILVGYNNVD